MGRSYFTTKMSISLYNSQYFHASKKFQKDTIRLEALVREIKQYSPKSVLDVGCGLGILVRRLRKDGIEAIGVDFASILKEKFWGKDELYFLIADAKQLPFKDKSFDLVFSSDFFEHIPEEEIDIVLKEMQRVGKKVMTCVAYEAKLTARQAEYHVTNKSKEWWEERLKGVIITKLYGN